MKKNTNQLFIRQIFLVLSLTFCNPSHGMDIFQSTKTFLFNRFEDKSYFLGRHFVIITQAIQLKLALFAYKLSPQACDLGIQIATNQLKLMEENLKQAEQDAINDVLTEFAITTEQQALIKSWIEQAKKKTTKHYQSPDENVMHDPGFPSDIFPILKNNNINPFSINLELNSIDSKADANASIDLVIDCDSEGHIKNFSHCLNPTITIFTQRYFALPIKCQKAALIHEAEHLRSMNVIAPHFLLKAVSDSTNKPISHIKNSNSYKKLIIIAEQQAEIFPAIRSAQNAEILTYNRYLAYYPEHLHLNHLQQLTEIQNLHHCLQEFKNHKLSLQSLQHQSLQKPKVIRVRQNAAEAQQLATE
jgi:hypothetical protein